MFEFDATLKSKCQLLGFLYLNEGLILVQNNNKEDSVKVFNSGFRFCIENIGELHLITSKIKEKVSKIDRHHIMLKLNQIKIQQKIINKKNVRQNCKGMIINIIFKVIH